MNLNAIFNNLETGAKVVKLVLGTVADIGGGMLMGELTGMLVDSPTIKPWKKACMKFAGGFLGGAIGSYASGYIEGQIDGAIQFIRDHVQVEEYEVETPEDDDEEDA